MKQKFASFLLTGKAATLPFYAPSVLADEMLDVLAEGKVCIAELPKDGIEVMNVCEGGVSAKITGCPGDAGTGPDVMNVVVTGLKPDDIVFLISADDKDGFDWGDFKLGEKNVVFLKNALVQPPINLDDIVKEALPDYVIGGALAEGTSCSMSIPVDLTKTPNPTGFNLQAVILRGDEVIFSEMDEISRDAQGETCPPAPEPEAVEPPCETTDMYGECVDDGGDDTGDDVYGGTGGDDTGSSEAGGDDTGGDDVYGGTGGDAGGSY
jgi:hypothetical protein